MTQAMVLADWLEQAQHEICSVLVGKSNKHIPDYFLERFQSKINFFQSPHFSYDSRGKGLNLGLTFLKNFSYTSSFLKSIRYIKKEIHAANPDVVVNFYDLLGGMAQLSIQKRYKYICVSHHFYLTSSYHSLLRGRTLETNMLKALNRIMASKADSIWALSFRNELDLTKLKIMPPLIRKAIIEAVPTRGNYILAYSVNEGYAEDIKDWHRQHTDTEVHYFWTGLQEKDCVEIEKNLFFHRVDQQTFTKYLINCKGYITTAGFESVCEALYLDKPVVLVPVACQIEQSNNALDALKTGNCMVVDNFNDKNWLPFMDTVSDNATFKDWVDSGRNVFLKQFST